jgi:hypothetical protein
MGFIQGALQSSSGKILQLPYTVNFNGVQSINIMMTNISTPNIDSFDKTKSSIIQPIPIDATMPQISFVKTHDYQFKFSENLIDHIQIQLRDDVDTLVNFNNQHWNLTLQFKVLYDVNRFAYETSFQNILKFGYN